MTSSRVRLAVIAATGTAQKRLLPAASASDLVEIVAVHGRSSERLQTLSDDFPAVETFTDPEQMLREVGAEGVIIASPPAVHREHLEIALRYVSHVLCEKPLAHSVEDAAAMALMSQHVGATVFVAHHLRHQPAADFLADLVSSGDLGRVISVRAQWSFRMGAGSKSAAWKLAGIERQRGPMLDTGIHCLDFATYLAGMPISGGYVSADGGLTDGLQVSTEKGAVVSVMSSWETPTGANDLTVHFETGSVRAAGFFGETACTAVETFEAGVVTWTHFEPVNPYRQELDDFGKAILGHPGLRSRATRLEEGLRCVQAIRQAQRPPGS